MFGFGYTGIIASMKKVGGASYGALTTAWITATGETDVTILGGLNTFETSISTIISKGKAVYPYAGGNATKHSYNFLNTALYQHTFFGGWTHNSNGAEPNGSNAYATTGINPSTISTLNNLSLHYYGRVNSASVSAMMGSFDGSNRCHLLPNANTVSYMGINESTAFGGSAITTNGLISSSRLLSTTGKAYKNGSLVYSDGSNSNVAPNLQLYVGALNVNNLPLYYTTVGSSFCAVFEGLTDAENTLLYNAIQSLQTTLARNV